MTLLRCCPEPVFFGVTPIEAITLIGISVMLVIVYFILRRKRKPHEEKPPSIPVHQKDMLMQDKPTGPDRMYKETGLPFTNFKIPEIIQWTVFIMGLLIILMILLIVLNS